MSDEKKPSTKVEAEAERRLADRGTARRMADHNAARRAGASPRQAIAVYCAGNRWLEENAKAVGNWPRGR